MPKREQQPSEIRIEWEHDKDYRLAAANRAADVSWSHAGW